MAFELPNGKTARNLQDQVKFLSEKLKDLYAAFNDSGLKKIVIVEELPEVGDPTVLYLLARQDPEQDDYYEEYLWYDNQWEKIGTTHIDLSDYCTLNTEQTITAKKYFNNDEGDLTHAPYIEVYGSGIAGGLRIGAGQSLVRFTGFQTVFDSSATTQALVPKAGSYNIGLSDSRYSDIYLSGKVDFGTKISGRTNTSYITTDAYDGIGFFVNGVRTLNIYDNAAYFAKPINPNTTNLDLGNSSASWRDLYLSGDISFSNSGSHGLKYGTSTYLQLSSGVMYANVRISGLRFEPQVSHNSSYTLGVSSNVWHTAYVDNLSDGTYSATVEALVKKARLYTHTITCSNGTLVLIGSFSASITSQSSLSMAASSALKMTWEGNTVLTVINGITIYYFDSSDSTIKSTTIGTFTSDSIMDY